MRLLLLTISFLLAFTRVKAQGDEIIKLAFGDKNNFSLIPMLHMKLPAHYYVLSTSDKWNIHRFRINDDLSDPEVMRKIMSDEHHPYHSSYIFRDSNLSKLFSADEKENLYLQTVQSKANPLTIPGSNVSTISSSKAIKQGFFFSIANPILTPDKQYAFIDIIIYHKEKGDTEEYSMLWGRVFLIYQYTQGKGWALVNKNTGPIF